MLHPVLTYGLKFKLQDTSVSLITDTQYLPDLEKDFQADIVIINVVFYQPRAGVQHLNFNDAKRIIENIRPKKAILTHFGMSMLKARPHILAEDLKKELGIDVIAAYDGMTLEI